MRTSILSREIDHIILGLITEEVINSCEFLSYKWTHCVFGFVADLEKLGHSQLKRLQIFDYLSYVKSIATFAPTHYFGISIQS